jgi:hypothetical protein
MPLNRDQKLFPHFGEAGAAVLAIEVIKQGGSAQIIILLGVQDVN